MDLLQFTVADMRLALYSNYPLRAEGTWQAFADEVTSDADFTYHCLLAPELPTPDGTQEHRYFDGSKNRYYAVTREHGDTMTIFLSRENLPWGTQVMQLYPQLALPHVLLGTGRFLLHSSYILTDRGAILFTAPSGTGKTTQAELWRQHRNAFIVNGDRCVIGLRGTAPFAFGYPSSGSSSDCHNITAPLRAIVSLEQAKCNTIRPLRGLPAVTALLNGCYLPKEYRSDLPAATDTAIALARRIPMLTLSCLPDESAVCVLEEYLSTIEEESAHDSD